MNKFIVIVPTYNAGEKIARCINSILIQDYKKYNLLVIDDCSEDDTWGILQRYNSKSNFNCHRNEQHIGSSVANLKCGIHSASYSKEDIIIVVDGDDYLAGDFVFSFLNEVYQKDIWLTYGQFKPLSGNFSHPCYPLNAIRTAHPDGHLITVSTNTREYRKSGFWVTSHPRTFKHWLFDKINDTDLRDEKGQYFRTCCDVCTMFPMIEMAGSHIAFIDKILYIYDDITNNWGKDISENIKNFEYLKNKKEYDEL